MKTKEERSPESWEFGLIDERVQWAGMVLHELFQIIGSTPQSLADFGGGAGSWCAAAKTLGVPHVRLIDRCPAEQVIKSLEPSDHIECNLEHGIPEVGCFQLAISIEVAEHLSPQAGKRLVEALCSSSDCVLFSAAIPGQGGIGHINEQWHEHWHILFEALGFQCFDVLRPKLITNPKVPWWLRQNLFVYKNKKCSDSISDHPQIAGGISLIQTEQLRWLYGRQPDLRTILHVLPSALLKSMRRKFG